jgi:2-polyprenyl-3-methyl-5-hydroxy-6-metoxy-1,4-benzoquinol methylase
MYRSSPGHWIDADGFNRSGSSRTDGSAQECVDISSNLEYFLGPACLALSKRRQQQRLTSEPDALTRFSVTQQSARRAVRYSRNLSKYGTHEVILRLIPPRSTVLDLGCAEGYLGRELAARGCRVWGVYKDAGAIRMASTWYEEVSTIDLDTARGLPWPTGSYDVVLAADVLEHLKSPETALRMIRQYLTPSGLLIVSLPNIAHLSIRVSLLGGRFDYRKTGILDETHLRFFTFRTARELVEEAGFIVERVLAGSNHFGRVLNQRRPAGTLLRGLLAYNIVIVAKPA